MNPRKKYIWGKDIYGTSLELNFVQIWFYYAHTYSKKKKVYIRWMLNPLCIVLKQPQSTREYLPELELLNSTKKNF